jgi:hypothetical protein
MVSATYSLSPISEFWKLNYAGCKTNPDPTNTKIVFHPPIMWGCNAEWQTVQDYTVSLQNAKLSVEIGGKYTLFGQTSGGIEFDVYGLDKNGNWIEIYSLPLGQMSPTPTPINIGDISNYSKIRFYVKAHGLTCSGCTPYIEPVEFTLTGEPPTATTKVNVSVNIMDASTNLPVSNAKVNLSDAFYNVNLTAITDNKGTAIFSDIPYNSADSYIFTASANGYKSFSLSISGSDLSQNQYNETINLTPVSNPISSLLENKYFLTIVILTIIVAFIVIIVKKPSIINTTARKIINTTKKFYNKEKLKRK